MVIRRKLLTSLNDNQSVYAVNINNDTHGRKMAGCNIGFGLHCLRLSLFNTVLAKIRKLYTTLDDHQSVYMLVFNGTHGLKVAEPVPKLLMMVAIYLMAKLSSND